MGDRGQVKVTQWNDKPVYLYSHYDGYQIDQIVQDVLKRKLRWKDGPYLTRMIFCAMVGDYTEGELGYGISSGVVDHYVSVNLHMGNQTVEVVRHGDTVFSGSFEDFVDHEIQSRE